MIARENVPLRAAYAKYYRSKTDKPRTVEAYEGALDHWERLTADPDFRDIDEQTLFEFQQSLIDDAGPAPDEQMLFGWESEPAARRRRSKRSRARAPVLQPTTANKILRHVMAILNRLGPKAHGNPEGRGLIATVPYVRPLPEEPRDPRTASEEEIGRIYRAAEDAEWPHPLATGVPTADWWRALVVVLYNLGLRRNDFLSLQFAEIDFRGHSLRRKSEKTRKRKPKPLHSVVIDHLSRILPPPEKPRLCVFGLPESQRQLYKTWYQIQESAGLSEPYYTFHEIRKTCGTAYYEVNPAAAQSILEHSSIATTDKYYANCDPILQRAVDQLRQPAAFSGGDDPDDPPGEMILRFPAG